MADIDPKVREALRTIVQHCGDVDTPEGARRFIAAYDAFRTKGDFVQAKVDHAKKKNSPNRPKAISTEAQGFLYAEVMAYVEEFGCSITKATKAIAQEGGFTICYEPGGRFRSAFVGPPHGEAGPTLTVHRMEGAAAIKKQYENACKTIRADSRFVTGMVQKKRQKLRKKSGTFAL